MEKQHYRKKSIRDQPSMLGGDFDPLEARISCHNGNAVRKGDDSRYALQIVSFWTLKNTMSIAAIVATRDTLFLSPNYPHYCDEIWAVASSTAMARPIGPAAPAINATRCSDIALILSVQPSTNSQRGGYIPESCLHRYADIQYRWLLILQSLT